MTAPRDPPDWQRVKDAFAEALERAGDERARFLDELGAGDPALRREVESLLAAESETALLSSPDALVDPSRVRDGSAGIDTAGLGAAKGGPGGGGSTHAAPDAARPGDEALPATLGRYRIRELLGRGGMGAVYLADDPTLQREVALKVLPAELGASAERRGRFLREARAAAALNHPNITVIHEIGETDGRDHIAFEHVRGRTLRQIVAGAPMALAELADVAVPLADALAYAHEQGVVHRDVKSGNVMVNERGVPKLLDFGLAKLAADAGGAGGPGGPGGAEGAAGGDEGRLDADDSSSTLTVSGAVFGTPGAMSPEQALGKPVDARTDVFSFGSLLYEMATGAPAFAGPTARDTMTAVISEEPTPLTERRPDLPPSFVAIVERALRKDPGKRYPTMQALADDLRAFKQQTDTGLVAPVSARARGRRVALGLAVIAMVVAMTWFVAVGGLGGAGADGADGSGGAGLAAPRYTAVMPFHVRDDPDDGEHVGAMLAQLLTGDLSATDELATLSRRRLLDVARSMGHAEVVPPRAATDVARAAGAATMILGEVARSGDEWIVTAEVVDVESGAVLGAPRARGDGARDLFAMAAGLARQVRAAVSAPDMSEDERRALELQLTDSVEAYRAFIAGARALRQGEIDAAIAAFTDAADRDPAFALAHYRLAMAKIWVGQDNTRDYERALAFADRLPGPLREFLERTRPYLDNDRMGEALPFLESVLADDPDHREALYHAGEVYTHSSVHGDPERAAEVYARLLRLEPDFTLLYDHRLMPELQRGRFVEARALLEGWERADPEAAAGLRGLLLAFEGREEQAAGHVDDPLLAALLRDDRHDPAVAAVLDRDAEAIAADLSDVTGLPRALALDLRAAVAARWGRFDVALALYERAAAVEGHVSPDGFLTNVRNGARHHAAELHALRGDLDRAVALCAVGLEEQPESPRNHYEWVRWQIRRIAPGPISASETDGPIVPEELSPSFDELMRAAARAHEGGEASSGDAAHLYRDAAHALLSLARVRAMPGRSNLHDVLAGHVDSGAARADWYARADEITSHLRAARSEAHALSGDLDGAIAALDTLIARRFEHARHPVLAVRAYYDRGLLRLRAGDVARGRADLRRFLEHWGDADWKLPIVVDARRRLEL